MLHRRSTGLSLGVSALALGVLAARPARAQQFSADLIETPVRTPGDAIRVFRSGNKMRVQFLRGSTPLGGSIYDLDQNSITIYNDSLHTYSVVHLNPQEATGILKNNIVFAAVDPSNPCPIWTSMEQAVAQRNGSKAAGQQVTCTDMGTGSLNGRAAHQWKMTSSAGPGSFSAWVDVSLHVPTKGQDDDGDGLELRNITPGPQPAALFTPPAGYREGPIGAVPPAMHSLLGDAAKDIGNGAAAAATDAARQKVQQKIRKLFHAP